MSLDCMAHDAVALTVTIGNALTTSMNEYYGQYGLPSSYIDLFAAGFSEAVAGPTVAGFYPSVQSIARTTFMLGIAFLAAVVSLFTSAVLWNKNRKAFRPTMLLMASITLTTLVPIILVSVVGGLTTLVTTYTVAALVEITLGGLTSGVLWQAAVLLEGPSQKWYRRFVVVYTVGLEGMAYYYGTSSFAYCLPGAPCVLSQRWITLLLVVSYIVLYMIPFLVALRQYLRRSRQAGLKTNQKLSELERRSWRFGIPSIIFTVVFAVWQSYLSDQQIYSLQSELWLALFCLNEVMKDAAARSQDLVKQFTTLRRTGDTKISTFRSSMYSLKMSAAIGVSKIEEVNTKAELS